MRVLLPCRSCGRHVFAHEVECPFCKASAKRSPTGPAILIGSAMIVATAACGGSLDGGPSATDEAGSPPPDASADTSASADAAVADRATVDAAAVDSAPEDVAAADSTEVDVLRLPTLDAALGLDADDERIVPVTLYRSPPRRADWS